MKTLLLSAALAVWALPVGAQEEAPPPAEPDTEAAAAADASGAAEAEADQGIVEAAVQPGDYVYEVGGRRDPFISLLATSLRRKDSAWSGRRVCRDS